MKCQNCREHLIAYIEGVLDPETEKGRLEKQKAKLAKQIQTSEKKLSNENFVGRAPEEVVQEERTRLAEAQAELASVEKTLSSLD